LLKLRKVDLLGFKSFCERTHITFSGTGITCIVGPNGCGKSNIVDAISWVLGEQSHKSLRAERMADCIFNGTAKRAPMGLAEVSLTLVDPELAEAAAKVLEANGHQTDEVPAGADPAEEDQVDAAPGSPAAERSEPKRPKARAAKPALRVRPGEIVVGRRLYRSGQSEYLINGRVVRLRDVQDLFMGVGLGPNSYAIIEQGRIGQILSSKPLDRRAILEEAAGVTKYKHRRRLAEAKLESAKLNLARVNDILVEVEKQLASLKRQASRARRYTELREQMRGLIRQILASRAAELDAEAERLAELLRQSAAQQAEATRAITALEAEQHGLSNRVYELEADLRQTQNLLGACSLELDRAENRIGFNRERAAELRSREQQLHTEAGEVASQMAALEERARAHWQSLLALREEQQRLAALLQALAQRAAALASEQHHTEASIEELRRTAAALGDELTRLHGEHAQAEQALAHHAQTRARLAQKERQLAEECAGCRERAQAAGARWQQAETMARQLASRIEGTRQRLADLRHRHHQTSIYGELIREELSASRAHRASLEQILNEHAYSAEAVQKLFAINGQGETRGFRAVGLLADYAEVAEQYEGAIEQFLREELEYIVVETYDHARAGIALLREEVGGRATFFVDSLGGVQARAAAPPAPFEREAGVVARLDRLVDFRDPVGPVAKQFLPKLCSAFLVEDAAAAERLAPSNPQYHFVTTDGVCYQGRMVSGGRPGQAGPLATKRELRALDARLAHLQASAQQAQAAVAGVAEQLRASEQALAALAARHLEAEKGFVAATHQRERAEAERAQAEQQLAEVRGELARLEAEASAARSRANLARRKQAEAIESRGAAETALAQASDRLMRLRQEFEARQEELAARRAEAATLAERLAGSEELAQRLAGELAALRQRDAALREQQAALRSELTELETHTAEQQQRRQTLAEEKRRLEARKTQLEQGWEQARVRTVQVDDALRLARQKLGDLREQRSQHEIEYARNESHRAHLRETCLAEVHAHPEDLMAQEPTLLAGEELAVAEASYRESKARVEAIGPINMMALEEYQQCEERWNFLTRERDDLVKSIEDTQQTIRELDEVSRNRFQEAFEAINRHFAAAFATLFGGGTGEMRLGEPDSSGECGIDIVAQPPGKRLQNVLLLSGGEKALTALALLIAIFRYQPSPFCILDEVDAPLDEANVGRFTKLIAEMSDQTQFLIVTHNRRTMEMGPVLYGVTMQEPGVSKLVSVRWDEPEAQPEQARTTAA